MLTVREADGEQSMGAPFKFDRIIANMVINLTEDP